MSDLKPCPFCGGEAFVNDNPIGTSNETLNMRGGVGLGRLWSVECDECGADAGYAQSVEEAIRRWNSRAERTCRMVPDGNDCGHCSACGYEYDWYSGVGLPTEDPFEYDGKYCRNCGAKVVER